MKKKLKLWFPFLFLCILLLSLSTPASAEKLKNTFVTENSVTYYYNNKGKKVKNDFVTVKKKIYFLDSDGQLVKKTLFNHKGDTYYADSKGVIACNKFVTLNGKRYFFNKKGVRQTGWVTYNNKKYYCPISGKVYTQTWKKIGKYTYYFTKKSYIAKKTWVDGYYIDSDGHRTGQQLSEAAQNSTASKKVIKMNPLKQNPELPTGCESVALTMVLKHYGFKISKTTIASKYLPRSGSNFVTAFAGNPFSTSGAGIYAPGLTTTANKYLKAKKSSLRAVNMTGISLKNLYPYIDAGIPVIVWNSMYMRTPVGVSSYYTLGKSWTFFRYEHCVVLCGYNKKTGKVLINDPLSGLVWRKASSFEKIYNKLGKMAVVIQ